MYASDRAGSSAAKCASWAGKVNAGYSLQALPRKSRSSTVRRRSCCRRNSGATWITTNMLQAIVAWSIRNRVVVFGLSVLLLVGGLFAARQAKLDVFPEFTPPQVVVQ